MNAQIREPLLTPQELLEIDDRQKLSAKHGKVPMYDFTDNVILFPYGERAKSHYIAGLTRANDFGFPVEPEKSWNNLISLHKEYPRFPTQADGNPDLTIQRKYESVVGREFITLLSINLTNPLSNLTRIRALEEWLRPGGHKTFVKSIGQRSYLCVGENGKVTAYAIRRINDQYIILKKFIKQEGYKDVDPFDIGSNEVSEPNQSHIVNVEGKLYKGNIIDVMDTIAKIGLITDPELIAQASTTYPSTDYVTAILIASHVYFSQS